MSWLLTVSSYWPLTGVSCIAFFAFAPQHGSCSVTVHGETSRTHTAVCEKLHTAGAKSHPQSCLHNHLTYLLEGRDRGQEQGLQVCRPSSLGVRMKPSSHISQKSPVLWSLQFWMETFVIQAIVCLLGCFIKVLQRHLQCKHQWCLHSSQRGLCSYMVNKCFVHSGKNPFHTPVEQRKHNIQ